MSLTAPAVPVPTRTPLSRGQAVGLVFVCTLLGAAGQMLIKYGATKLASTSPLEMLTNLPLFGGYALYGVMTVIFIFALRDEELSILYPVISLTYVWVAGLSIYLAHLRVPGFTDTLNLPKTIGVITIVFGVAVLGRDGRK